MDTQRLIELANELLQEENLEKRNNDLLFLKRQYSILANRDCESYFEQEQINKFNSLKLRTYIYQVDQ